MSELRHRGKHGSPPARSDGKAARRAASAPSPRWFSENPSKSHAEKIFLVCSPIWIGMMVYIVASGIYESFDEWSYLYVGIAAVVPYVLLPVLFPCQADSKIPFWNRFWVKGLAWIVIFSYIGNYIFTWYFYKLLKAKYTFPSHRLNDVPIPCYLLTVAYFAFYHALTNITIRRIMTARGVSKMSSLMQSVVFWVVILILSYITAFMETKTIEGFPYYTQEDHERMLLIGSVVYSTYFIPSFPLFYWMDENEHECCSFGSACLSSFGGCMMTTMMLDHWRLFIGDIISFGSASSGLPWLG